MHAFVCTDLAHAFASPDKNCLFVKSRNLRLALPVMHLPHSSLIFLWRGLQNFQSTRHFKGQQKRVNCCFKCIVLVEYSFYYSLSETDKSWLFSPLLHQVYVGWSSFDHITGAKWVLYHFARFCVFLREEPQMVHFAMDSVCVDLPSPLTSYLLPTYYKSNT